MKVISFKLRLEEVLMATEYKPNNADIEDDKMLKDILYILQPESGVLLSAGRCGAPEEKEFEIYAALVRHGRSKEDALRIARAIVWNEE